MADQLNVYNAFLDKKTISPSELSSGVPNAPVVNEVLRGKFTEYSFLEKAGNKAEDLAVLWNSDPFYPAAMKKYLTICRAAQTVDPGARSRKKQIDAIYGYGLDAVAKIAQKMQAAAAFRAQIDEANDPLIGDLVGGSNALLNNYGIYKPEEKAA